MQQAVGAIVSLFVTAVMVRFLIKRYQPQIVIFSGGIFLLAVAAFMGVTSAEILGKAKSTGFIGFDLFRFIQSTMSSRVAGLGLMIMSAGGYAAYMDKIGASKIMVATAIAPLSRLKAPYFMMVLAFWVGVFLKLFIPSAAGVSLLLMVTIYPIIVALGASKISAATMVILCGAYGLGPASGNVNLAATNANLDVMIYFVEYQIPVAVIGLTAAGILLFFSQRYFDKKEKLGGMYGEAPAQEAPEKAEAAQADAPCAPKAYIFLPAVPLVLLLLFSPYGFEKYRLDVVTAMFISFTLSIACECVRHRNVKAVFKESMLFFQSMGKMFASVISLIIAGETFAKGLTATGAVDLLISSAQSSGFSPTMMTLLMTAIILFSSFLMGSGNAAFFSFAALAPKIAKELAFPTIYIMLPMQLASGVGRVCSPISAVVVAVAGISGEDPFDLVRRVAVPAVGSLMVMVVTSLIFLGN